MTTETYTDEQLTAFLDGELDAREAAELEKAVNEDNLLAERLEALSIDKDAIKASLDLVLNFAPAAPLEAPALKAISDHPPTTKAANQNNPSRVRWAASLLAAAVFGGAVTFGLSSQQGQSVQDWHAYVASYQALYVPQTLAHVTTDRAAQKQELARAEKALGKTLPHAAFDNIEGLEFKRAQVLGFKNKPLVQLAFVTPEGIPVALCIISKQGGKSGVKMDRLEGQTAASWQDADHAYLIIGHVKTEALEAAAKTFATRL